MFKSKMTGSLMIDGSLVNFPKQKRSDDDDQSAKKPRALEGIGDINNPFAKNDPKESQKSSQNHVPDEAFDFHPSSPTFQKWEPGSRITHRRFCLSKKDIFILNFLIKIVEQKTRSIKKKPLASRSFLPSLFVLKPAVAPRNPGHAAAKPA